MNLYDLPYVDMTKVAGRGPNPYASALVSGDPNQLMGIMSEEDRAFFKLSEHTIDKLACGDEWTPRDIEKLSEDEVAAITVLGPDTASEKVARYLEFYDEAAGAERAGRAQAQLMYLREKQASAELDKVASAIANHPVFVHGLAKRAQEELARRRG